MGTLRGTAAILFLMANTVFWCLLLFVAAAFRRERWKTTIAERWIDGNSRALDCLQNIVWEVRGLESLRPDRSYLVCANHQSWVDIVVLQRTLNHRIPFLRFFIKHELIYVPLLGWAWKALDFPIMKRHSKEFLQKHPEKRGEDLATTRKFCERFKGKRLSVLNFLEGTRFTEEKHARQKSPYRHLLKPKAGGLAFVIEAMGEQFYSLLDVTIAYPAGAESLWGLVSGRVPKVIVSVNEVRIPQDLNRGNYMENPADQEKFRTWVHGIWSDKDTLLASLVEN